MSVALRAPPATGVNVTLTVHVPEAFRLVPQVLVWLKSPGSAPVKVKPVMGIAAVLALVTVTVLTALWVPTFVEEKVSVLGEIVIAAVSVPVRETVCGVTTALSLTVMFAVRWPAAAGVKVTVMVQVALIANVAWQVCLTGIALIDGSCGGIHFRRIYRELRES